MLSNDFIVPTNDAAAHRAATDAALRRARTERAKAARSLIAGLAGLFRPARSRRRNDPIALAMAELHAMSDRELADLGIGRSDIAWVVRHGRPGYDDAPVRPANDAHRPGIRRAA